MGHTCQAIGLCFQQKRIGLGFIHEREDSFRQDSDPPILPVSLLLIECDVVEGILRGRHVQHIGLPIEDHSQVILGILLERPDREVEVSWRE